MEKFKGMSFYEWCELDPDDERKINYTLKGTFSGKVEVRKFTSEDKVDLLTILLLRDSIIENLSLEKNEWFVSLVI